MVHFEFEFTYKNVGRSPLNGRVDLRFTLYDGSRIVKRASREIRALNTNQSGAARFFPDQMTPGMRVKAVADSSNLLPEANEANNQMTRTMR